MRRREVGNGFELATGRGLVGTGVHLWPGREASEQRLAGDAWLTLLFLPLVPLGVWTFESSGGSACWRLSGFARPRPLRALTTLLSFWLGAALAVAPAVLAVTVFMGYRLLELGGALGSVAGVVLLLSWLDGTWRRVSLAGAASVLRRARSLATAGPEDGEAASKRVD